MAVLIGAVVGVVAVAWLFLPGDDGDQSQPAARTGSDDRSRALAVESCGLVDDFRGLVEDNGSAEEARAVLREATELATQAAASEPRWRPLAGATQALEVAIERDDRDAARIGIIVARSECSNLRP